MVSAAPARELLMDAAEMLIAERGMTVTLRELAAAAGQRNNSAVIYHFGGLDGLVAATLQRRMDSLEPRRAELLAGLDADSGPADIVAAIVGPALTIPYEQGATHYARFVESIRVHSVIAELQPSSNQWPVVMSLIRRLTPHVPGGRRAQTRRIRLMATAMFSLMADYERRDELASPRKRARATEELTALLVALVITPVAVPTIG
ncbi:TetR family transcriptional regulator [Mycolicibacterium sp. SCSIO 43805]|uniref:TetR family transcriptional regulator n=1 Tax=Mycolicibacterium sp. SCSIO 43805 TaxID=3378074 RepID=UPI003AB787A4